MITRDSFTVEEWGSIISVPASIGALVVTADPSGPLGLLNEFRAIMKTMKEFVEANNTSSPLMTALHTQMTTKPTEEEEAELKRWAEEQQAGMKANRPETAEEMGQLVRQRTGDTLAMLRTKDTAESDIDLFKQMMVAVAESVAEASKEGGFLGFGGVRVSEQEQSVLAQIRSELGA